MFISHASKEDFDAFAFAKCIPFSWQKELVVLRGFKGSAIATP